MGLTRCKLGDLILAVDERNDIGIKDFYGININKEFIPTAANIVNLDETKYKVVRNDRFVYSGMQTGRDNCIRTSMYAGSKPIIVSPAYTTFEILNLTVYKLGVNKYTPYCSYVFELYQNSKPAFPFWVFFYD